MRTDNPTTSLKLVMPLALLCVALAFAGCDAAKCELRSDAYEGADVLPHSKSRADDVIAALEMGGSVDVTWDPPDDFPLGREFPPAPFHGPDVLMVSLEFDDPVLYVGHSYDLDYNTCSAGNPAADVTLIVDSKSGHMHERVPSVVAVAHGQVHVSGSLDRLSGPARAFEPKLADNQSSGTDFEVDMNDRGEVLAVEVRIGLITHRGNAKIGDSRGVLSTSQPTADILE